MRDLQEIYEDPGVINRKLQKTKWYLLLVFVVLILRLGQLQLAMGAHYEALADGNRVRLVNVNALRGQIYDREGRTIATNRPAFTVSFVYMDADQANHSIPLLAEILDMDAELIYERIEAQWNRLYQPVTIVRDVSPEIHSRLEEQRVELPGVIVEAEPVRDYPYGSGGAHILGYVHQISERQLASPPFAHYKGDSTVGQDGIESSYEHHLAGMDGGKQVEVDVRGRYRRTLGHIPSVPGNDLEVTMDMEFQVEVERLLTQHIEDLNTRDRDPLSVKAASAVVLDVNSGAVLALANHPSYDPNEFASGISTQRLTELNALRAFVNRAIGGTYAPGSIFKMVTALAALAEGKTTLYERVEDRGHHWVVPTLRCWREGGHGMVDLERSLIVSCNVYYYEMGRRLGIDGIAHYGEQLGLGGKTGIDLPGEASGLLPTSEWKEQAFAQGRVPEREVLLAEHMLAGMGQGFSSFTPLQMAVYAATLANGGTLYQPYVLQRVIGEAGNIIEENRPRVLGQLEVKPEYLEAVNRGMLGVTKPGGTAAGSFAGFPLDVAGKTGSAENPHGDAHAWFMGFAPYDNPQIAVAVLVEQGRSGGAAAAPLARDIMGAYLGQE